jgi:hypothetical protein
VAAAGGELAALVLDPGVEPLGVLVRHAGRVTVNPGVDVMGLAVSPGVLGAGLGALGLDGLVDHPQEPGELVGVDSLAGVDPSLDAGGEAVVPGH